ncbi:hypothetical protein [Amycolatopsis sp. CA-230715]|uniref:hypothetical protein n=1 Tax=Amycolatopsis sp. CA-230715 TaxID=2745196 RepID=UPI001C330030|nr:hypothetical protein HUW46_00929 [Amycolatopsis sp. CA-230715]
MNGQRPVPYKRTEKSTVDTPVESPEDDTADELPDRRVLGRRASLLAVLTAVIVLATATAVWSGIKAASLGSDNAALADTGATAEVTEQVGAAVKAIFSFDYANLDRTERASAGMLVDNAVGQYRRSFAAAKKQAGDQKLVRSTTIREIGVRDLHDDTARLLVFVDQQTIGGPPDQASSTAHLDIGARKVDGTWKIADLIAL